MFTQPEVTAVGVNLEKARALGLTLRTAEHVEIDRAISEQQTAGFPRLVLEGKGRVVGATIVGPRAGESLAEAVLAVRHGQRGHNLAAAPHAYPTYSDGLWKAAIAQVQAQLTGVTRRATRAMAGAAFDAAREVTGSLNRNIAQAHRELGQSSPVDVAGQR